MQRKGNNEEGVIYKHLKTRGVSCSAMRERGIDGTRERGRDEYEGSYIYTVGQGGPPVVDGVQGWEEVQQ